MVPSPPETLRPSIDGCAIWAWLVRPQFFWFCSQPSATSIPSASFFGGGHWGSADLNVTVLPLGVP